MHRKAKRYARKESIPLGKSRKALSKILTFIMIFTAAFGNFGGITAFAADTTSDREIDIWDFGGIQTAGELYNNHITPEILDSKTTIKSGSFATTSYGDFTLANPVSSDRSYYFQSDGTTLGVNSSGSQGYQKNTYDDGYISNGIYYANGTGGINRRFLTLDHVVAGDKISVYGGLQNGGSETIHFVHAAISIDGGTVTVTPDTSEVQDSTAEITGTAQRIDFIAQYSGSYQIYISAAAGKPYFHRVTRTPGVKVSGTVNVNGSDIAAGYSISFTNQSTNDVTTVEVNADNTFDAVLATGYEYVAALVNTPSYRFSDETKLVSTSIAEIPMGKSVSFDVVENQLVNISGNLNGFDSSYDVNQLQIKFAPPEGSLVSPVTVTIDQAEMTYTADVQDGVAYTAVMTGVNDYEIVDGGNIKISADTIQDMTVAKKAVYTVTGQLQGLSSTAEISSITFTNVNDGYVYSGTVENRGYTVSLRDGAYSVSAVSSENYSTSNHVVIRGQNTTKDILFVSKDPLSPLPLIQDLYVGDSSKEHNFNSVKEALAAAARMNPTSEDERITIHISPGVYRAQLVIRTPYITLQNAHPNPTSDESTQVKITWYYGIGYQYYSAGTDGYYNEERAFDKYAKNTVSKWGATVYITNSAAHFKAKNIIFENSFNKYMTDEELADGVELDPNGTIHVERKLFTDVTSKDATERAAAIVIEGDNAEFLSSSFLGSQDTLNTGNVSTNNIYFKNAYIEGNTDFIYGDGNVVFDNVTLNIAGYSNQAVGGYITAPRESTHGYLFRNSIVTADNNKNIHSPGYFGRPWGANARAAFLNTKLQVSSIITPVGWTQMSGNQPENAHFREYNTTYQGAAVDTSQRIVPALTAAPAINLADYFGDWIPTFYSPDSETAPTFKIDPFFTTDGDINIPYTGNTISLGYEFENANDNLNDSSLIQWYRVSPEGSETLIHATTTYISKTYKMTSDDVGYYIKAVVTPEIVNGLKGEQKSIQLENLVRAGSSGGGDDIPDGELVNIYIAGDSTVKTYGLTSDTGGWGEYLQHFFDSEKIKVVNYANGGRSSRSFINEGSLDKIASTIKTGDYLLIQFGHNDSSNGSGYLLERFVSMGEADANGVYPSTPGEKEATPASLQAQYGSEYYPFTSGSFKWYLQQYIDVAKDAGAIPILVTPVSRQYFNADGTIRPHHDATDTTTGTVTTSNDAYVKAVQQLGEEQGVKVIDMFELTKDSYEKAYKNDPAATGTTSPIAKAIMPVDSTHNNKIGGFYNGGLMAKEIQGLGYSISNYVVPPVRVGGQNVKSVEFEVDSLSKVSVFTRDANGNYSLPLDEYWTNEIQTVIDSLAATPAEKSTIWIIGDSTVSSFMDHYYYPRYGWGTQLGEYLDGSFHIQNIALSGRSSKSYTTEPQYQTLLSGMKSGDFLLIGFGHNDQKTETERYTNPNGSYLTPGSFANSLYENYIKPAQAAGTQVILATPIVRRTVTGEWSNSNLHITAASGDFAGGDYPQAIRDLGTALSIPVVDMTSLTKQLYDQLGPAETLYLHAWTSSKPASADNTHTNIWGGAYNAYFLTKAIKELGVSGLAEHVLDADAPTKADTLVTNPDYQDTPYTGELPQSALWADHGFWKGTVFGDIGGNPSTANQTLETDSNGNMHIAVANNKGKIANGTDGIAMYYYQVPADSTFTLTAKVKINDFNSNDQVSFGLMARDEMYIDSLINTTMGDYVAAAPLKLTQAGEVWNSFARKSGVLTRGGTVINPIKAGDVIDLRLEGNSDGYAAKIGNEATITGGFDFKLTSIDPDYVYVGMFVARNADITFSDIKLIVDSVEVVHNPKPEEDITAPTWINGKVTASNVTKNSLTLTWDGASDDVGVAGYKVYQGTSLLASVNDSVNTYNVTGLSAGTSYTFTVQAGDKAGNWSANGPSVTVRTDVDDSVPISPGPTTPATPTEPITPTAPVATTTPGQPVFDLSNPESVALLKAILAEKMSSSNETVSFEDVSDHWSAESITVFLKLGVVNGYEDGMFKPNANITRGEFAAIVVRIFNIGIGELSDASFKDIDENWAKDAILALASNGIINGYEDGTFRAKANITRAEMIAIISRIINLQTVQGTSSNTFNDIDDSWNKEQLEAAAKAGVINGVGEGLFAPDKNSTRAEALTVLLRSLKLNPEIAAWIDSLM